MQNFELNETKILLPKNKTPLLVLSLNNGSASAVQAGYIITVTCANTHNIPSSASARINDVGVSVFLDFSTRSTWWYPPLPIISQWCANIKVTSAYTFTCTSSINQTITTPILLESGATLNSTVNGGYHAIKMLGMAIKVQPNDLKVGSSIRYEGFVERPLLSVSRKTYYPLGGCSLTDNNLFNNTSHWNSFCSDQMSGNVAVSRHMHTVISFLDSKVNSDFASTGYGAPGYGGNATGIRVSPPYNYNIADGFMIVPYIQFFNGTLDEKINDYALWSMSRAEIAR